MTEHVPVERKNIKYEYVPVERYRFRDIFRKIVHIPEKSSEEEMPRYLGVRERSGSRVYDNVHESDLRFWEKEYGYKRGEPIEVLNRKIREKI